MMHGKIYTPLKRPELKVYKLSKNCSIVLDTSLYKYCNVVQFFFQTFYNVTLTKPKDKYQDTRK